MIERKDNEKAREQIRVMYNVLICDDEADIVSALEIYLSTEGYGVFRAENGLEALDIISKNDIHLLLLDIMMPVMNGIETVRRLREVSNVPVIMITAKGEDDDKILGLDLGADDYITKPFNPMEVKARVRSQLRRYMRLGGGSDAGSESVLSVGGIRLDERSHSVTLDGESVTLTPTQYGILRYFMKNTDHVLGPAEIYRAVWDEEPLGAESTVAVHIRHLREKLEINPSDPRYLRVVWGHGYIMPKRNDGESLK